METLTQWLDQPGAVGWIVDIVVLPAIAILLGARWPYLINAMMPADSRPVAMTFAVEDLDWRRGDDLPPPKPGKDGRPGKPGCGDRGCGN